MKPYSEITIPNPFLLNKPIKTYVNTKVENGGLRNTLIIEPEDNNENAVEVNVLFDQSKLYLDTTILTCGDIKIVVKFLHTPELTIPSSLYFLIKGGVRTYMTTEELCKFLPVAKLIPDESGTEESLIVGFTLTSIPKIGEVYTISKM